MPVTAPCSAARTMAAVRALQTAIATPSTYGLHIPRVLPTPMTGDYTKACLFIPVTTSIPTPLVCAVSWMRIILQKILQIFFDVWSGYGTLQCFRGTDGCPGAYESNCYPYVVWSGTPHTTESESYHGHYMDKGVFHSNPNQPHITRAYGVRCVLELEFEKYSLRTDSVTNCPVTVPCSATM